MQKIICAVIATSLALLGCSHNKHAEYILNQAESLMEDKPDSAFHLLQLHENDFTPLSASLKMKYSLTLSDAQNKAYIPFTSDSIAKQVAAYYEDHGNANQAMKAYYILGCVYRDMGESPSALKYLHTAINKADTTARDCDFNTLSRIYGQIAELFHNASSPFYELEAEKQALRYALICKDTLFALQMQDCMTDAYYLLGQYDTVIHTCKRLLEYSETHLLQEEKSRLLPMLACTYIKQKRYDLAKAYMDEFESDTTVFDKKGKIERGRELYYFYKHMYYDGIGKPDSAFHYLSLFVNYRHDNVMNLEAAYKGILNYYVNHHQPACPDSIAKYAELYCSANDTSMIIRSTEEMNRIQTLYNYHHNQMRAIKKENEVQLYKTRWIVSILCMVNIIGLLCAIYHYKKKEKDALIRKRNQEYSSLLSQYVTMVSEKEMLKSNMNLMIQDKEQKISSLERSLRTFLGTDIHIEEWDAERELINCPIVNHLHKLACTGKIATNQELDAATELIRECSPTFYDALTSHHNLTRIEQYLCILTRLHFIPSEIGCLLHLSSQRITNMRSSINMRIFNVKGAKGLENNLSKL